jgi:hypothetical protein
MVKFYILDLKYSIQDRFLKSYQYIAASLTWRRRVTRLRYAATLRYFTSGIVGGKLLLLTWSFLRFCHFLTIPCNVHSAIFKRTAARMNGINCDIILKFPAIWYFSWMENFFLQHSMSTLQCVAISGNGFSRTRATNCYQSSVTQAQHCPSLEPIFFFFILPSEYQQRFHSRN